MAADRLSANPLAADDIREAQPDSHKHAASIANWLIRTLIPSEVLMPRQTPNYADRFRTKISGSILYGHSEFVRPFRVRLKPAKM